MTSSEEILAREKNLYLSTKSLEECAELNDEMVAWDKEFSQDGLDIHTL